MELYFLYVLLGFVAFSYAVLLAKHLLLNYDLYKKVGALAAVLAVLFTAGFATSEYMREQRRIDAARLAAIESLQRVQEEAVVVEEKAEPAPKPKPKPKPAPKLEPKPKPVSNTATVLSFSRDAMIEITKNDIDPNDLRCLGILNRTEELLLQTQLGNEQARRDFDSRELELYSKYDFVIPSEWITEQAYAFVPKGIKKMPPNFTEIVMSCLEE